MSLHRQTVAALFVLILSGCGAGLCVNANSCSASLTLTSGTSYDFGNRSFGATHNSLVYLTNEGNVAANSIGAMVLAAPFSYVGGSYPGTGGTCATELAGGDSCSLAVSFSPASQDASAHRLEMQFSYFNGFEDTVSTLYLEGRGDNGKFTQIRGFDKRDSWIFQVDSLLPVADGVFVGGSFMGYDGTASQNLVKLDADRNLDAAFSVGTGFDHRVLSMAYDSSRDRLYVGGHFTAYQGTTANYLVALKSDGSIDTSFNVGSGLNERVQDIIIMPDGNVVLGGGFTAYQGTAANYIIRLTPTGAVDTTFAYGAGFNGSILDMELWGTDIYVVGSFTTYQGAAPARVARLNSDGTPDAGFAAGSGFIAFPQVWTVHLSSDGSGDVYFGGDFTSYNGNARNRILRVNSDGSIDGTFSIGTGFNADVYKIFSAPGTSGAIYVITTAGFVTYKGSAIQSSKVVRIDASGNIDPAFALSAVGNFTGSYTGALVGDGTNDLYLAGDFLALGGKGDKIFSRVRENGTVVSSDQSKSGIIYDDGGSGAVSTIAGAADGTGGLWVAGAFEYYDGTASTGLVRINYDGSRDTGFVAATQPSQTINVLLPYSDGTGRLLVGGTFSQYNSVATPNNSRFIRLLSNGTLDPTFTGGPSQSVSTAVFSPAGDGKIYVGGNFTLVNGTSAVRIARLASDGTLDTGFVSGTGFNSGVYFIRTAPDGTGDILVAGNFTQYNGTPVGRIVRLTPAGAIAPVFAVGTGFNGSIGCIDLAADGSWYIGGSFTSFNGTAIADLAHVKADGTLDTAFNPGTGFDSFLSSIKVVVMDGETLLYAVGDFYTYRGESSLNIVRILSTGERDTRFDVGAGLLPGWSYGTVIEAPDGSGDVYVGGHFSSYKGKIVDYLVRINSMGDPE